MVKYVVIILIGFTVLSCEEETDLAGPAMQQIVGAWDVVDIVEEFRNDTLVSLTDVDFEAHFLEDATGYNKLQGGLKQIYDWYYQHNPEKVILIYQPSPPLVLLNQSQVFTVLSNSQDAQVWTYDVAHFNIQGVFYRHTWTMTRQ